ncbi:conserved hypothetical protein [Histoplasma capsulatum var. duboisii H88]|uniref:Uncharacterized protein n=1 Tax=Ajellomyces capsulatus (strain H88) TaxID=544711 RepID=F0UAG0_AJEC8|nr:conserved hypothetical protein [Histoplasma capsulatum var. duboisii H88]
MAGALHGNGETTATGSSPTSGPQQQTAPLPQTANSSATRQSFQSSFRGSLDHQSSVRPRLPADRIHISDWTPPQQSMMASTLSENDQLATLRRYVKHVEEELQRHNELRGAMSLAFTPRHPNANKALANWERKSSYLLREIVKFRTYIDCLTTAQTLREKIRAVSAGTNGNGTGTSTETPTALHGLVELKTSPIDRPRAPSLSVS